jgi:hypothetical protein
MTPTAHPQRACTALVLAIALGAAPVRAQEANPPSGATSPGAITPEPLLPRGRILNGHIFMPAQAVPGALITTSFMSGLLVGYGTTKGSFATGAQTFSGEFKYSAIGAVLAYEYAVLDNLSFRVGLTEQIFSGVTGQSVIVVGSNLQLGLGAGATFSLPIGDTLRVGVLLDASVAPNIGLTIGNAIQGVVTTCQSTGCSVDSSSAFQQKNVVQVQPALAANWAPFPALGITSNVSYIYAHQTLNGREFNGNAVQLGLAGDWDFRAISRVPIGLQLQFSWTAPTGSDSGLQHVTDLGGGIFYTGRPHLALGAQLISRQFAVTPDVDVSWSTFIANLGMRYYW